MKVQTVGVPAAAFAVLLGLPLVLTAEPAVLFSDDFSYATAGSIATPHSTAWSSADAYSVYTYIYSAGGTVKLGKTGAGGLLATTNLTVRAGTLAVQVDALGWDADEKTFDIAVGGTAYPFACAYDKSTPTQFQTFTQEVAVAAGVMTVAFQTAAGKRIFLDNILITHTPGEESDETEFFVYLHTATNVHALAEVSFTITAAVGGAPTNVAYAGGLPAGAAYTFADGLFSWTPELDQTGVYDLTFTAADADGAIHERVVGVIVTPPPLTAPAGLAAGDIRHNAFRLFWETVPAAVDGYAVDVWYGSTVTNTPEADLETFFEIADSGTVAAPAGWTFSGVTERYATAGFVELKFDNAGDALTTKLYPAPVTELSFRIKGYGTDAASNNVFTVQGSADGGTAWTPLASYTTRVDADGDDENNIFTSAEYDLEKTITLDAEMGHRRFRFVLETKETGNIGLAQVAAVYCGSGARFVRGWQAAAVAATNLWVEGVPHSREILVRIGARAGGDVRASQIRLATPACPLQTILILR